MDRRFNFLPSSFLIGGCLLALLLTSCEKPTSAPVELETPAADGTQPADAQPAAAAPSANGQAATEDEEPASKTSHETSKKSSGAKKPPFKLDWPQAKVLLVFSGGQHGYLEPCGCAGLDNMKGGLGRRHTLLRKLEATGAPVLPLDSGDLVKRSGPQAVIKYHRSIDSLLTMKYRGIGFGMSDLRLQPTDLIVPVPADDRETPFVSANVGLFELGDETISARFRVFNIGGMKIGMTTVLADEDVGELSNADLELVDAEEALREVVPQLEAAKCDRLLLLVSASVERAEELAVEFPQFDFVVATGESDPPPPTLEEIDDTETQLIELSHKGMYVGLLGFFDDADEPVRYRRVAIDSRFEDSAEMKTMLAAYQDQLQAEGFERLGIFSQPAPHNDKFVGSKACQECHESEFEVWNESGHAHAFATLTDAKPPRHFDPECLSCHVVGWEPQQYAPIDSGFASFEKTPHLINVGCENCHGPGGAHVALEKQAEAGDSDVDEDLQETLYDRMRVTEEQASQDTCIRCHDLDNSPDFEFEKYWSEIEH